MFSGIFASTNCVPKLPDHFALILHPLSLILTPLDCASVFAIVEAGMDKFKTAVSLAREGKLGPAKELFLDLLIDEPNNTDLRGQHGDDRQVGGVPRSNRMVLPGRRRGNPGELRPVFLMLITHSSHGTGTNRRQDPFIGMKPKQVQV